MSFSMTPVTGYPPVADGGFPTFIQIQDNGTNLGGPDADTLNFVGSARATRGVGENAGTVQIRIGPMSWNEQTDDYTLQVGDAEQGVAMNCIGDNIVTVPADDQLDVDVGTSILVYQEGAGQTSFMPVSGVELRVNSRLAAALATQDAVATLIKRAPNVWVLAGDLGAA